VAAPPASPAAGQDEAAASLLARLPAASAGRLEVAARVARGAGVALYLVGGSVRDLLLGRESPDLDLVVEGDGMAFAARLAAELGGRLRAHPDFLTAVVFDPEGVAIDVATARSEVYRAPAALPEVQRGTLAQDLFRRDFTVNALAIDLNRQPPTLIDLHGGRRDLERGALRVLHGQSFLDDPTRVLRGVRLERRFGLRLDAEAERLARAAMTAGAFDRLSGGRLRDELVRLLDEPAVGLPGFERLAELGLLAVLHPRLVLDERTLRRLEAAREIFDCWEEAAAQAGAAPQPGAEAPAPGPAGWAPRLAPALRWRLMLMALAADLGAAERMELADRLLLAGDDRRLLVSFPPRLRAARQALDTQALPHQAAEALKSLAAEELVLLAAEDREAASWVRRYLGELSRCELALRGADLLASGAPAGSAIGEALRATWRARVDGEIAAADELAFALGWLRQNGRSAETEPRLGGATDA
jgi:tRNA nucleotidyltransferase (CCA-adding enzyme)